MTVEADEHDPEKTIWSAVSNLEKKAFTRREIYDHLLKVAENIRPQGGFNR